MLTLSFSCVAGIMSHQQSSDPDTPDPLDGTMPSTGYQTSEAGDDIEKGHYSASSESRDVSEQNSLPKEGAAAVIENPNLVDWDGPDDPKNPMNWSSIHKWTTIGLVSTITFVTYDTS
jgi:hypothetical protein